MTALGVPHQEALPSLIHTILNTYNMACVIEYELIQQNGFEALSRSLHKQHTMLSDLASRTAIFKSLGLNTTCLLCRMEDGIFNKLTIKQIQNLRAEKSAEVEAIGFYHLVCVYCTTFLPAGCPGGDREFHWDRQELEIP